jgi:glycerol-3-phosphate acyltransferase PlsY
MIVEFIISGLIAYLLGSIPTAVWVGKVRYGVDVREHGSKNAGATNTFRVLGKKPGIVVLSVDIIKGATAVLLPFVMYHYEWGTNELIHIQLIAAIMAVFGHVFPLFAGFRGGKGVATSLGVIVGLHPLSALVCIGVFLIVFMVSRFVSLGAMTSALLFPFLVSFVFKTDSVWLIVFSIALSLAVIIAHRKNINRLIHGEENKMNLFRK